MIGIDKITLAIEKMDENRHFYAALFEIEFQPVTFAGQTLFSAQLDNLEILLCPKDLAGVDATINTIQLRFVVSDVQACYDRGLAAGGQHLAAPQDIDGRRGASLRDPDGNSLELIQP